MAAPSVSNITQIDASDANTWNSATVGNADGAIVDLSVSQPGINPPNTCQTFENATSTTTANLKYSAYSPSWTAIDISQSNQAILFHFAGNPGQFNRVSTDSDGISAYCFDSGGARTTDYLTWELGGSDDKFYAGAANFFPILLFAADGVETGALDETDIVEIGIAFKAANTGQFGVDFRADQVLAIDGEVSFDEGDSIDVGTWAEYYDLLRPDAATGTIYNGANEEIRPFYGWGYPIRMNCVEFNDSNFTFAFLPEDTAAAFTPPATGYYSLSINPSTVTAEHTYTDGVFAYDSGTYPLDIDATSLTTGFITMTRCSFLNTSDVTIDGAQLTMSACTITDPATCSIANADLDISINNSASAIQWDADLVSGSTITTDSDIDITFAETDLSDINIDLQGSTTLSVTPTTGSGTYDLTALTTTGTVTLDNLTANDTTIVLETGVSNVVQNPTTGGGAIVVSQPTTDFTINVDESASDIRIFDTGTQTELAGTASGNQLIYTHTGETVDYTVQKAGFIPQRRAGLVLSGNQTVNVDLVEDPVYNGAHGLVYPTDLSYDRALSELTLNTIADGDEVYSALIDAFIAETILRNTQFPIQANGPSSFFFLEGAEFNAIASINNWKRAGFTYVAVGGATAAEYLAVYTLTASIPGGAQARYQQTPGSGTTNAINTGAIDQVIQIFGDATHGNFTLNTDLVVKYQENTFKEIRVDVVDLYNEVTLSAVAYPIATPFVSANIAAGDPGVIGLTLTNYGASPITREGETWSIGIEDTNNNSDIDIIRWLNWNISQGGTFQGEDAFNWHEMAFTDGANSQTVRGVVEGSAGATLKGVWIERPVEVPHPDFFRQQADNGNFYVLPVQALSEVSNIVAGSRLYIYNQTTDTVIYNDIPGTSYSVSYVDGTDYSAGDIVEIRLAQQSGTSAQLPFGSSTQATSSGWTILADQQDDTVYNNYAIDGSTVTEYSADFPNVQVDVNDPDNVFFIDRFYAWWVFNLQSALGIVFFWDGVRAVNESNILIIDSVVDVFFDNVKAVSARQGDNIVIQREDGQYPQAEPTSGGGGLGFYYLGLGFTVVTGDGPLTPIQAAQLSSAASNSAIAVTQNTDIQGAGFDTANDSLVQIRANLSDATEANQILILDNQTDIINDISNLRDFNPEVDLIDGETFAQNFVMTRDQFNTIVDDGNGNSLVKSKDGTRDRYTFTYDENTGSRDLTSTDNTL